SNLAALAASASQINLTWVDNASNETGFKVERSADGVTFAQVALVGANVTAYSDTGLAAAAQTYYRHRPTTAACASPDSNVTAAFTPPLPDALPTSSNLAALAASASQINLTWVDNASNETGFKVERSTDGTTFTQVATVGANVTAYSNTGLAAAAQYYYRVRATNAAGDSAYSNEVAGASGRDTAAPAAPTNAADAA